MSKCSILDAIHVLEGSCSPFTVRLNATSYLQPCWITWMVRLAPPSPGNKLFAYTLAYRAKDRFVKQRNAKGNLST